jgi:hypothetical protein
VSLKIHLAYRKGNKGHSLWMVAKKIFRDVAPCKLHSGSDESAILFLEDRCQCSGGTSFFHLQSSKFPKMEKAVFSNKMVSVYQTTRCHIPEDYIRLTHMTTKTMNLKFQRVQRTSKPTTVMILWHTYPIFWKNKPTQNTTVPSYYFNNKLMCLNVTVLAVVASGHRSWCIKHWKLCSSYWPSLLVHNPKHAYSALNL